MLKDLTSDTLGFWQLWLQVQHKNLKSILMCCLVNNYINSLSFGIEIFVLGDINFDLLKSCHEGDTLKDLRHTLDLTQHVTSPTRVMPQSSSLIDFILATNTSFVKETRVVECHGQEDGIAYGT